MNKNTQFKSFGVITGFAALFMLAHPATAQIALEQTAAAIPVDAATLNAQIAAPDPAKESVENKPEASPSVSDYKEQIGNGLKERERRLVLLNDAMMRLREAGEMEDAGHVEERIRALLEMPAPSQTGTRLRAEIEQLRMKNDDLVLQLLTLQENSKRGSSGVTSKGKSPAPGSMELTGIDLEAKRSEARRSR